MLGCSSGAGGATPPCRPLLLMSKAFCTFHRAATHKQVGHSCNLFIWVLKSLSKFKLGVCQPYYSQWLLMCLAEATPRLLMLMRAFPTVDECRASHFLRFSSQNAPATELNCPRPELGTGELATGQTSCFFSKHRALQVHNKGLPGCYQEVREYSERNTAWHLAAKTLILSENTDVCERAARDGV